MTTFLQQYIETALWSSTDDNGDPLDRNYSVSDLAPKALATMTADCEDFVKAASGEIWEDSPDLLSAWYDAGRNESDAGHDFWLTRNRHGAGFWDRFVSGTPEAEIGKQLTELARGYGSCDLYIGDDGLLYIA